MSSKRILIALALVATAALPALAAPNFSGNWKLNAAQSSFGQMPAPSAMTQKVTHEEPKLTVSSHQSSDMGDFDQQATYTTDGKESTNEGFGGNAMKSTAKWDGDNLLIATKGQFGDNEFTMSEKWTLSADGKTLTITRTFKTGMGDMEQKMVFDKQ